MEPEMMGIDERKKPSRLEEQAKEKQEPCELLEVQHFRTIYNIFVAMLCIFIIRAVIVDSVDNGCCVFLMKIHSFLRETVPPIFRARSNHGKMQPPEYCTYLYFLFCPTFLYREHYPRTPYVRWSIVIKNFTKFFGCAISLAMVYKCHFIPVFSNINKHPFSFKTLVLYIFNAIVPAIYALLLCFFGFLHCWQNAFAEMLCFADRSFYKDWWNSTSFPAFFRSWNVIVHDWLYYYIYQDLLWVFKGKAQSVALLSTVITSAAIHEYITALCFRFFYPFQFILWILMVLGEYVLDKSDPTFLVLLFLVYSYPN